MTPKQKAAHAKRLKDLDSVTSIAASPGNAHANEYMLGMANGLLLAQSIFTDKDPKYLTAPEQFLSDRPLPADFGTDGHAVESDAEDIAMVASSLVGAWIADQMAAGQTSVDLKRVNDIRTGIELALT